MQWSDSLKLALDILHRNGEMTPAQFARQYFPKDHPGWNRHCKCGPKGTHCGSGLVMWAGGFLGKLCREGLACRVEKNDVRFTTLTRKGRDLRERHLSGNYDGE